MTNSVKVNNKPGRVAASFERREQILDVAAGLMISRGYDKTTIRDVAEEAGLGRGLVYLLFKNKDEILEALIHRELLAYVRAWIEHIEADPRGGTIGGIYRAVLYAINQRPFMAALMRRDRRLWGNYLRKPGSVLNSLQAAVPGNGLLKELQVAGAIRADADLTVAAHILDLLSYGMVTVGELKLTESLPPFETVLETIGDMLDRLLTPADGGNAEAAKDVIRVLAAQSLAQLELMATSRGDNPS